MKNLPNHLGGHAGITHLDAPLLEFLVDSFALNSFLDVGCGPGGMVKTANEFGLDALGIDGDFKVKKVTDDIIIHDFRNGVAYHGIFDLGWSVEFLEHVEETYMPFYMSSFSRCQYVFATHAPPGATGHHHVNCQDDSYWVQKFEMYGFEYDEKMTKRCREASGMRRDFVRDTGLFFRNRNICYVTV